MGDSEQGGERMTELKPCPFCGCEVKIEHKGVDYYTFHHPRNDACFLGYLLRFTWDCDDLTDKWNLRIESSNAE